MQRLFISSARLPLLTVYHLSLAIILPLFLLIMRLRSVLFWIRWLLVQRSLLYFFFHRSPIRALERMETSLLPQVRNPDASNSTQTYHYEFSFSLCQYLLRLLSSLLPLTLYSLVFYIPFVFVVVYSYHSRGSDIIRVLYHWTTQQAFNIKHAYPVHGRELWPFRYRWCAEEYRHVNHSYYIIWLLCVSISFLCAWKWTWEGRRQGFLDKIESFCRKDYNYEHFTEGKLQR